MRQQNEKKKNYVIVCTSLLKAVPNIIIDNALFYTQKFRELDNKFMVRPEKPQMLKLIREERNNNINIVEWLAEVRMNYPRLLF